MLFWICWILIALAGGFTQTVTGFGSALVMMLVLPQFKTVVQSAAIASGTSFFLSLFLTWNYRKKLNFRKVLPPVLLYLAASLTTLQFVQKIDLKLMGILFGGFLTVLGLYYLFFAEKLRVKDTPFATVLCSLLSGVCAACFGVGGPLMALLFLKKFPEREEYSANLQLLFLFTNLMNTVARIMNGIFTLDLIPAVLVGAAAIWGGKKLGLAAAEKLSADRFRKSVYLLVIVSGLLTLVQNIG